jgi:5-methylcytosine-specific restriction protein A
MQDFLYSSVTLLTRSFAFRLIKPRAPQIREEMAVTQGHGNPDWSRDETILALDLYFNCNGAMPKTSDRLVLELSSLLRSLPYHSKASRKETFRNAAGVVFKLKNLHKVATGEGFTTNVSKTDRLVWAELGAQRNEVAQLADLIKRSLSIDELQDDTSEPDGEEEFFEGRLLTAFHKKKERNRNIRNKLIAARHNRGPLACDMCGLKPQSSNARFEDAPFEAHHLLPMSMAMERKTQLKDMALLCANCHRLLHRAIALKRRWLTVVEARKEVGVVMSPS